MIQKISIIIRLWTNFRSIKTEQLFIKQYKKLRHIETQSGKVMLSYQRPRHSETKVMKHCQLQVYVKWKLFGCMPYTYNFVDSKDLKINFCLFWTICTSSLFFFFVEFQRRVVILSGIDLVLFVFAIMRRLTKDTFILEFKCDTKSETSISSHFGTSRTSSDLSDEQQ